MCDLWDGTGFVSEDSIRAAWPECPSHATILNMGVDVYFDWHCDIQIHAYMPTARGIAIVREKEQAQELQQLRQDFDKYRSDEAAYKASQELKEKQAAQKAFRLNIISSAVAGIISGLLVYYWSSIVGLVLSIFR